MDTIYALASAAGKAGVAVIRISGPDAFPVVQALVDTLPDKNGRALRTLTDGDTVIDRALVLRFDTPASFTGEDVIELHLHGSRAVIAATLDALGRQPKARIADAGEFTRRALENGRLDLSQVEGLADLIDAETEIQRKQALRVFSGALGDIVSGWRRDLIRAAALLEATIDFADEDVPVDVTPEVRALLTSVQRGLQDQRDGSQAAERVRDGFEVAIVGPPNAGKSTLLNRLAGRDAAITSEIAGTTRDIIEVRMDIAGLPVTLLDTAGLRESTDVVEALGVQRARDRAAQADLRIFLVSDLSSDPLLEMTDGDLRLVGKDDDDTHGGVSGVTGAGIDRLLHHVEVILGQRVSGASIAIRQRHVEAMELATRSLEDAIVGLDADDGLPEMIAEDIRAATRALATIVGNVDVESLLDEIFSSFCIGK